MLPAGFAFPIAGVDVWVPKPSEWSILPPRFWRIALLVGFARLKPGVTLEQARAEMDVLNQQYIRAHHPYDTPEILVWQAVASAAYGHWITAETERPFHV